MTADEFRLVLASALRGAAEAVDGLDLLQADTERPPLRRAGIGAAPISVPDVAKALGVHRRTIYRLVNAGEIPVMKLGSQMFVSPDWLDAFLNSAHASERQRP
ncbi:MAG: Helix-turn-helix domain [Actinomycetota bacterium]|jgi:excisionase family DNA binding protein